MLLAWARAGRAWARRLSACASSRQPPRAPNVNPATRVSSFLVSSIHAALYAQIKDHGGVPHEERKPQIRCRGKLPWKMALFL